MRIKIPTIDEGFQTFEYAFCNIPALLIIPKVEVVWNELNIFFRSLIVDKEGNVLSSGWPKFFNYNEKPSLYPDPKLYKDWTIQEKIDGSLLIADFINDQFSMRTRGCVCYTKQENAKDFELLPKQYPKIIEFLKVNSHISLLFEIVTPNNVIVVRPKELSFYLLGAIDKNNLTVISSQELLDIWRKIGCVPMPQAYQIDNIKDLSSLYQYVKNWKGSEGVVVSYNKNQNRVKIKSEWYLWAHRIKSELNTQSNFIEYYIRSGMPSYEKLKELIEKEFDFEIAQQIDGLMQSVCDAGIAVQKQIERITHVVHDIRNVDSRKEQAEMIKQNCHPLCAYAFSILDNKPLTELQWSKLLTQELNQNN